MTTTQPTFIAYSVRERGDGKPAIWTKIGVAFPHKGAGFTVNLDALPLGSRILLREPKDDKADVTDGGVQ